MFVKPLNGRLVPDPAHGDLLPASGRTVEANQYWQRRLAEGDVAEYPAPPVVVPPPSGPVYQYGVTTAPPAAQTGETAIISGVGPVEFLGHTWVPYNRLPTKLKSYEAALNRVVSATGQATIACVGDSTTAGQSAFPSYVSKLMRLINSYVPARMDSVWGDQAVRPLSSYLTFDPRVTDCVGWSNDQTFFMGVGGNVFKCGATAGGNFSFAPTNSFDTITVYYMQFSAGGIFSIGIDGGADIGATINTAGTSSYQKVTRNCALGTHTVNIKPAVGNAAFYICGIVCYDSTTPSVNLIKAGSGGAKITNIVGSGTWDGLNALSIIDPDLTIISANINDAANPGTNVATYTAQLASLVTRAASLGDVVMMTSFPQVATGYNYTPYMDAVVSVAKDAGAPVIDWRDLLTTADIATYGYYQADNIHPSNVGYAQQASHIHKVISV